MHMLRVLFMQLFEGKLTRINNAYKENDNFNFMCNKMQ